ncbi:MAG: tRNA epoxyqueuosine(34) reductase QueG [Sphingomonadaceae bacterium]
MTAPSAPKVKAPSPDSLAALQDRLRDEAVQLGFDAVGFAAAKDDPATGARLHAWIGEGMHGEMGWMEARAHQRQGPQSLWPEARSVIALGASYAPSTDPLALEDEPDRARISVYAQGRDYHDAVKKKLKALARWLVAEATKEGLGERQVKVFVDTAPVMEKPLGQKAGLGWQGKHTNLVSREHGSWLFLGAVYSDLPFAPDPDHPDRCGSCADCQRACPTDAFPQPYKLDARRCISYLTIEHAGPIPEEFRAAMGNRIYGCDDCLAVCPWNKFADTAHRWKEFLPRAELVAPRLAEFLALDDAGFRSLFSGSPIKRIGRNRFVRNCLIAAGNSGEHGLLDQVGVLREDPDPVVAEAAEWAAARLTATT